MGDLGNKETEHMVGPIGAGDQELCRAGVVSEAPSKT